MSIDVVILAAGQGSRMKSSLPKVLHKLAGKPMVLHVIDQAKQLANSSIHVVVGHGADQVEAALANEECGFYLQAEQKGTGHAVAQAVPGLRAEGVTLVLYGDVPLTPASVFESMVQTAQQGKVALLTVKLDDPTGYGRIIRSAVNDVVGIVEQKDANPEQLAITEVNTGIMAMPTSHLIEWLPQLSSNNAQGEYYLTDLIAMAANAGISVQAQHPESEYEVQGVNNRRQLAELERWYQLQQANRLMDAGVTLADPTRIDVRGELVVGSDVEIDINFIAEGSVKIGSGVTIGPNCVIKDAVIGDNVEILANSHIDGASVAAGCQIGPYARLRPGSDLAAGAKAGNFVEIKKAKIGEGSKVNHLTYIGDAVIGKGANIGAGTITCNYDGVNKSLTEIGDNAFIGSNSSLVAPVKVGAGATIGAGSTITSEVGDEELSVARGKQRNIAGWQRPVKKS
ncbi:bifunctional UDP-N-acetylglucosamine diphosphorylase/glucosamine-1-phosphate N-acetyltransferase GlmU [Marinobacterium sp. LSUCC0821]|jgi:bifunctional UDP-N-acetylglucosamine pyrophosphorylase/glucosamine-1-phosphate N-acetyltransferase|uniref:bifunctional UDP-N-acetylglucosamine diphosphorylase/glucosamine-1-phosphate N-acetyltransferase GlmU n=1 Tax=Marinobacterium sp. LSUCC0821 TaxID=2668067 RepID=UPI001451E5E5|nr:bifunctional UDP-N-acetylglucosamine diphosphorylase/glucosamine-1-phosphate N-acetyltransferase GlmU [Marinobacterium sp. LSUCC0821]QJD71876.1 bifunctional UDP-N-acetylglucosamine diphosphorylase/glucosamine-1-phosphate N-acetyltransferase GlmU [Marinobacterium sp. LSUCC0821]